MLPLDWVASLRAAQQVQAQPHECYLSAWRALMMQPWLKDAWLVEGWAVTESPQWVAVLEHGWLEMERAGGAVVIDPSFLFLAKHVTPVFFSGVRYSRNKAEVMEGEIMPNVRFDAAYAPGGFGHPTYAQAFRGALAFAGERVVASGKLLTVDRSHLEP